MPEESSLIEALKKAGEELEETEKTATSGKVSPKQNKFATGQAKPKEPSSHEEKEKTDLAEVKVETEILSQDWLKEITNERQKLEKVYKEVENLRKKIQQRLDRMRNLEANFSRVKNELTHFQQIKKENEDFLKEIKNILKIENE